MKAIDEFDKKKAKYRYGAWLATKPRIMSRVQMRELTFAKSRDL